MSNSVRLRHRCVVTVLLVGLWTASAQAFYFVDWPGSGQPPRQSLVPPPATTTPPNFTDHNTPGTPWQPVYPQTPGVPDEPGIPVEPQSPNEPEPPIVPEPATLIGAGLGLLVSGCYILWSRRPQVNSPVSGA